MAVKQRLIDANYLVNKGIRNCPIEEGGIPLGDFAQHQKILELYPTVDAVEVVRCKDCKFFHDKGYCTKTTGLNRIKPEDDFCSRGERRMHE